MTAPATEAHRAQDCPAGSGAELVGRADELARLHAALARAEHGSGTAVFVAGEAGVGKTRLLRELERHAAARGVRVARGECTDFPGAPPYSPVAAAVRGLARTLGPAALDALHGPARPVLARLVPELGPAEPDGASSDQALARARLFRVLRALLARAAAEAPVVVAIEDLHWADPSTLAFLSALLPRLRDQRLLLLCTYRSDELHRRHHVRPFLAEAQAIAQHVGLSGLSPEALAAHVTGILGRPSEPAAVARLHARTAGNPFFAEELLAGGAAGAPGSGLCDVLGARIARLPDAARAVVRVAALAGREPGERLVAKVAGLPGAARCDALRAALDERVLAAGADGCAFRHGMLREAACADLLPGERAEVHVALARALSEDPSLARDAAAGEIAHHWTAAHRLPEALGACVRAGIEAERLLAFAEAGRHFELALEIWDLVEDAEARAEIDFAAVVAHASRAASLVGEHHRAATLARADSCKPPLAVASRRR